MSCMDEDCGNRAGAGAHVVGGPLHVYWLLLQACSSLEQLAEHSQPDRERTHLQMQGEVSVPCMDEDCGNRAGAGAHVVGGLLHVHLGNRARLGKHARTHPMHSRH